MKEFSDSICVIIPAYNAQNTITELLDNLVSVCVRFSSYQIILVDDHSTDHSFDMIKKYALGNKNILGIRLDRNISQQMAIFTGLKYARCDFIVTMDDDLQHNPIDIITLYQTIKQGYDAVYALPSDFAKGTLIRRIGTYLRESTIRRLTKASKNSKVCSFRMLKKSLADQIAFIKDKHVYLSIEMLRLTSNITSIKVVYQQNAKSRYTLQSLISQLIWLNRYDSKQNQAIGYTIDEIVNGEVL